MLGSEYNAIIQAAIYGFAVPVIIGISILFTTGKTKKQKESSIPIITVISGFLFAMAFTYVIMISLVMLPDSFHIMKPVPFNSYDIISEFARGIYIDYVWAFELLSLLLTIIIAGLTLFREKRKAESRKSVRKGGKQ
jgi:NADH:ubiquinone oxidoreductase subunit 6 (subunit J)